MNPDEQEPLGPIRTSAIQPLFGEKPNDPEVLMLTLWTGLLLAAIIVIALYAFGLFNTPYLSAFRFTFYLLLALLILSIWFGTGDQPNQGYDPTVGAAR
jgi:hypothetical protein